LALGLLAVGRISLWQVAWWKPTALLHKPMLWVLYLEYACFGIGLLAAAVNIGGWDTGILLRIATHVHIIGMGGFTILIIGMVTRTALGHLGRPLALDQSMLASYYLMVAAVVLRLAALFPTSYSYWYLRLAAITWIASFALYLWRFIPML